MVLGTYEPKRSRGFVGWGASLVLCLASLTALGCGGTDEAEGGKPLGSAGAGGHNADGSGGLGGEGNDGSGASSSGGSATGGSGSSGGSGSGGTGSGSATGGAGSGGAGSGGTGSGGSGGAANQLTTATKLDLLFVIDNSISMGDKQALLSNAVPGLLLEGLVHPPCLNSAGESQPSTNGTCPTGYEPAHAPLDDVHIGVITSSLGSHGGTQCATASDDVIHQNDMARLLPTVRSALDAQPDFLTFSGGSLAGTTELLQARVVAAEDRGCGYEAPLEAMYRFLVDPTPPLQVIRDGVDGVGPSKRDGLDTTLLAQRAAFLRPDSAVMVVLLTDENDCSVVDTGSGWAITTPRFDFTAGSEVCDTNPNDACCYSCLVTPPAGCEASPRCATAQALPDSSDRANVRCFEQKRRFGLDLLYPTQRYVDALTLPQIKAPDCWGDTCPLVENPLFPLVGDKHRSPGMVFLLGIVGVPWQDLATEQSLASPTELTYLSPETLAANGRWNVILGKPHASPPVPPTDPLVRESIVPRTGKNPITNGALAGPDNVHGNPINGNETNNAVQFLTDTLPANNDLQYACIFPLATPIDCTFEENLAVCDCADAEDRSRPLCQANASAPQEQMQYFAKAYPAPRILEVLQSLGTSGITTSICPKDALGQPSDPNYGYNPALYAGQRALWRVLE